MADLTRTSTKILPTPTVLQILLRSFLFQASWNFERLQNLGFLFVILPGLKKLYRDDDLADACRRHLEYFNSHPFLAPTVLGASLHLESDVVHEKAEAGSVVEFKKMVMAPYAAMGDAFFWGGLRPLAAVTALFFAFRGSIWAIVVFLALFNIPHLVFRILGFVKGLSLGLGVIHVVQGHRLPDLAMRAKEATVILFGGLAAVLTIDALRGGDVGEYWGFLLVPSVLVTVWLLRRKLPPLILIYAAVAGLTLCGMVLL